MDAFGGAVSGLWASAVSSADALVAWVRLQRLELFREFFEAIGIAAFAANLAAIGALVAAGLLYGVFHAIGPGPGKAALAAYLLSHPVRPGRAMALGLLAALAQGCGTALLVALGGSVGAGDRASAIAIAAVGALLAGFALVRLRAGGADRPRLPPIWLALAIGLRPDLVGMVVLSTTQRLGVGWIGAIATAAMALGTGLAIAAFCAVLAAARGGIAVFGRRMRSVGAGIAVLGGIAVCGIGALLLDPDLADALVAHLAG